MMLNQSFQKTKPAVVFWHHVLGSQKRIRGISEFPEIKAFANDSVFVDAINKIYGSKGQPGLDIRLLETIFFYKPPKHGNILQWHQDVAYFPFEPNNQVAFWIPLDPTDVHNGTLQYVVGSHKEGLMGSVNLHTAEPFEGEDRPLIPSDPTAAGYEVVLSNIGPGDMTIHDGLTWHCSSPNSREGRPRLAMSLRYLVGETRYKPRNGSAATFIEQMDVKPGEVIKGDPFPLVV